MEVSFKPAFIKDFPALPSSVEREVRRACLVVFPEAKNVHELFGRYDVKPLRGFKNYYRVRLGAYRIGFKKEDGGVVFMRVLHRKEIYRHFP